MYVLASILPCKLKLKTRKVRPLRRSLGRGPALCPAALGAADVPAAVRAWADGDTAPGRKVWNQLADLGVTALAVAEEFDGLAAHPVDLVVACERLGRWCVPGPVTESIAVAPVLLAADETHWAHGGSK